MHYRYKAVVTHPFSLCLICKRSSLGRRVYKSDTNLMGVLQLLLITQARVLCLIYVYAQRPSAPPGTSVFISGKAQVPML